MPKSSKTTESIVIGELGDSSEIRLRFLSVIGKKPGKCLWVLGAVHGDELNSTKIALELYKRIDPQNLFGTLIIIPIANPTAFQQFRRISPIDDLDMNRVYPGESAGSLTQRTAKLLLDRAVRSANMILDFHSGGMYGDNWPYVIYQHEGTGADLAYEVAVNFGTEIIIKHKAGGVMPGPTSLLGQAAAHGVPCVTPELGGGISFQPDMVELGIRGAINTMITLEMMEGTIDTPENQFVYSHRDWVTANRGGICNLAVSAGATVNKGQVLAAIEDLSGDLVEELVAPFDGCVTLLRQFPPVRTGDWIALLADASSATAVKR